MAGYLDQYGAGDERREKRNKWIFILGAAGLVLLFFWFFLFVWDKTEILRLQSVARLAQVLRNHKQENQVRSFLGLLQRQDYKAAYAMWGCTDAHPCKDYTYAAFMKDWGPQTGPNPAQYTILRSRSCGSGVIVTVDFAKGQEQWLWVQRSDLTMGFSPFQVCRVGT